jgi:hypothetical protein
MITYNWNCKTVDVHPQEEGETNVVYNVHWIVTGADGDYSATNIGTQILPSSEGDTFIPFEDLTNEIVVEWTKEAMGEEQVAQIEATIAAAIEDQVNPSSVTLIIGE